VNSSDLFDYPIGAPLAARMRPTSLAEVVGQSEALNPSGPMAAFLSNPNPGQSLPSILLYGPPGSGKTTIARLLAKTCGRRLIEIFTVSQRFSKNPFFLLLKMEKLFLSGLPQRIRSMH